MTDPQPTQASSGLFTFCPACQRQFRLHAAQLSTAAGKVECGLCGHQFNALTRLHDNPVPIEQLQHKPDSVPISALEPSVDMPLSEAEKVSPKESKIYDQETVRNSLARDAFEELTIDLESDLPDELHAYSPNKKNRWTTVSWTLGAMLLGLTIIVQLAWFNRDLLLTHYPELLPVAKKLCKQFDCRLFRHKDISSIKLLNRDVRSHPLYVDSLLINATMMNTSATVQSFPSLQLALFNISGQVIAYQEFKPQEYLQHNTDIWVGMVPELVVHFVLEVSGKIQDAVSFEFHFI